ncbi:MAG: beta-propeller domain-containing protein [Micrococcales bacterium]|nr:beta-propeller domain-containing protein [Micrococcales bacterium]
MNDKIFRDMAEQMKPSDDLVGGLMGRLDQLDQTSKGGQPEPKQPVIAAKASKWWRSTAVPWFAAAACLALAAGVGVWAVSRPPVVGGTGLMAAGGPASTIEVVPAAAYADVYEAVEAALANQAAGRGRGGDLDGVPFNGERDFVADAAPGAGQGAAQDYRLTPTGQGEQYQFSLTNTQVAGIDEGDIVKTDGKALYVASGARVEILLPDGANTRQVATIDTALAESTVPGAVLDMMLSGDTLVVFTQAYEVDASAISGNQDTVYVPYQVEQTVAALYNVSDPASPELITYFGQSGSYASSRLVGNVLYLVSDYSLNDTDQLDQADPSTYVPMIHDGEVASAMVPDDILLVTPAEQARYAVASAIDLAATERLSAQTVLAGAETIYMSPDNLFLAATIWNGQLAWGADGEATYEGPITTIVRLALNEGQLAAAAQDAVPGQLLNQFSLDERDGFLRLAVDVTGFDGEQWLRQVSLYVLDSDLAVVGLVDNLAQDETVKSVRFDGEVGYVVTFRQTDPLFAVDLSQPSQPEVMSALKIPGFSAYLHPWAEGKLLGLGVDGDEDGRTDGLKLAMFDTSDPYAVDLIAGKHLAASGSEALDNHKAVLVDTEQSLIGFPTWSYDSSGGYKYSYVVYSYDPDSGFWRLKDLPVPTAQAGPANSYGCGDLDWGSCAAAQMDVAIRGLLIDEWLVVATAAGVDVYSMDSFDQIASVELGGR